MLEPSASPSKSNDALSQADRVAAETLIRSTALATANGASVHDIDELVRRNADRISQSDIRSGRLSSNVLGDIISTVEQAKGNTAINWHAATPQQMKAYLAAHGLGGLGAHRLLGSGAQSGEGASRDSNTGDGQSGARFAEIGKMAMEARDIALSHGMGWAANNRELLKLGPAAMQALADVHLRQDSYQRFRDAGLSNRSIVSGAHWAKRNGVDYNEFSQSFSQNQNALTPADRRVHKLAADGLLNSSPTTQEAATGNYNRVMDQLKTRRPELKDSLQREQDLVNKQHKKEHTAAATADSKVVKADAKEVKVDDTRAKMEAILKARQAAQSAKPKA